MRNVSGYWIGGFGLAESMDVRPALLNAVTSDPIGLKNNRDDDIGNYSGTLARGKPTVDMWLELPEEILQGVAADVDLFESTYIYHLTLGGFALTFPLDRTQINASNLAPSDVGSDPRKINLRTTVFRKDTTPIVEGCTCYTCRNHTRAYINHLLNVHEMLALILLEMEAITADRFEEFCKDFVGSRYDHLVEDGSERFSYKLCSNQCSHPGGRVSLWIILYDIGTNQISLKIVYNVENFAERKASRFKVRCPGANAGSRQSTSTEITICQKYLTDERFRPEN
ncbi:hypothetical protein V6N11_003936 [Hibiscus sabdariffa]|uniref:tRNA-guanine(15) transglycosylase-like domain-containing protein n=1 Tax=Hibiscus sabdariffa TaxID=183260 RepID=A0ABR2SFM3_9ROSI